MRLTDAVIGKEYLVLDIQLCDDCVNDENQCMILGLMTRGLVPGSLLTVVSKKLGMYELKIDETHMVIRQLDAERFNIEVE